jgi:diguanylate cyclase (GGDEF)-like protein
VNRALAIEVREREMLEFRLAAANEQEMAARHAAFHDPLTGLPNRALFDDRLENALAQAKRHKRSLAVMFLDLDEFKAINDSYGHDAGDSVLQTIARRLKESARNNDTISRFGGDEFLYLLMEASDRHDIERIARKIIAVIEATCHVAASDGAFGLRVRASIGIAIFPENGDTAELLVKNADSAMYTAKQHRSGFEFATQ